VVFNLALRNPYFYRDVRADSLSNGIQPGAAYRKAKNVSSGDKVLLLIMWNSLPIYSEGGGGVSWSLIIGHAAPVL
jgi:hypothetical protein